MPLIAEQTVSARIENVVPLTLPRNANREAVVGWALAAVAEAEKRVEALQERIAYLESLSITDEMTGLLNRRGFMWELDRALAIAKRGGPHGVVMLFDLDGFKAVNDALGHSAGDEVLRRVARTLAERTRRVDILGRIGGDEFAVVLVGATLGNARRKSAGLIQSMVAATSSLGTVGASFGFAAYMGEEAADDLLKQADIAMYGAKRRNRRAAAQG